VTYHPSAALRDQEASRAIRDAITEDLRAAWERATQ
jgi:hypothetical protein